MDHRVGLQYTASKSTPGLARYNVGTCTYAGKQGCDTACSKCAQKYTQKYSP